jgi:hypothetical protein
MELPAHTDGDAA